MKTVSKVAAVVLAAFCAHAQALVIDSFTEGAQSVSDTGVVDAVGAWSHSAAGLTTVLGGQRDIFVIKTQGTSAGGVRAEVDTDAGTFDFSQDSNKAGTALLRWDGANTLAATDTAGLGSVNFLSFGPGITFTFKSDSQFIDPVTTPLVIAYEVTIEVWGNGGADYNTITQIAYGTFGNYVADTILFNEAGWSNAGFNFGDVSALQLSFNTGSPQAIDVDISITAPTSVVPEPMSLALVGLALVGVAASRRRRAA